MANLRCGVVGVGQLGQHHVRIYRDLPETDLVGVYDSDPSAGRRRSPRLKAPRPTRRWKPWSLRLTP